MKILLLRNLLKLPDHLLFIRLDSKNYSFKYLIFFIDADPLQVGVTVEALKDTKDAADQDLPLQRSIKRTNISVLAMTGNIAT